MSIDKTWMFITDRRLPEWQNGMKAFLDMAFAKVAVANTIQCPCRKCDNVVPKTRDEVALDLCKFGMDQAYKRWIFHGEELYDEPFDDNNGDIDIRSDQERCDDASAYEMINNMIRGENLASTTIGGDDDFHMRDREEPNDNANKFYRLLWDAEQKLYPSCKTLTKLSFVVTLFQMKCLYGWSDKSIEGLLELFRLALPEGHLVLDSLYSAKKIIRDLGLDYEKIDACINDYVLYRNEYASLEQCPICMESRWKSMENNAENESDEDVIGKNKNKKKVPQKILRYFPLTPRLQRLFMTKRIASDMRWHKEGRVNDGVLRHPANSMAWKRLDKIHSWFALDSRNVRLGLATDGFNPFGVKECKVFGLKTHDCHVIFQCLLSLVIRGLLLKKVCEPLIGLSSFFRELFSKELSVEELDQLDHQIAKILCKLEQVFPPSFFDVMMHLPIHLAYEAKVAGPVQYRWMYPIERYLRTLKGYVRNKARPEGSIAEGYISEECMTFCSWYLHDMDTKFNRPERNVDASQNEATSGLSVFASVNRNRQNYTFETLSKSELQMAHHYILTNCEEIAPWVENQSRGYRKDEYGFINVDVTRLHYKDDPFILGIQAEQVYYAKDVKNPNWCAVIRVKPRNLFAMPNKEQEVDDENNVFDNEPYQLNEIPISQHDVGGSEESSEDVIKWCRGDIEGLSIEVNVDEDRHLEDDYISNNNDTDLEEDECLFWMAPPSTSQQRQPQTESFQPSTIRSNRRQKEPCSSHPQVAPSTPLPHIPPPPNNVLSQIQIETSVSQPLEDPSTLQPTHKIPSHARRPRPVASDSAPAPKRGRGALKGLKVAKKASESNDGKLSIMFSAKLGGPIEVNCRSFVDEVVVQLKHHLPLIGVKNWKEIPQEAKNTMKAKVLERWRLADDDFARAKIFKIAQERYRGWRADLSATHKAYAGDMEALIRNKPEELDIEEWKAMIAYFETDDFKRDRETQKEPDALELWAMTYCPKGYMSRPPTSAERVRDEVNNEIQSLRRLLETERAERAEERVEREAQIESLRAENQTQLESLRQSMREEFMGLLANQSQ
uniref:Transposase-associated domain-containing protein n=1 Tax=Fagus sylvatica TaxID=28930 RepID=A0A2N9FEG8_FAGSY